MVNWPARGTKPWDTPLKAYLDGSYPDKAATEAALGRVDPGEALTEGQVITADGNGDPIVSSNYVLPSDEVLVATSLSDASIRRRADYGFDDGTSNHTVLQQAMDDIHASGRPRVLRIDGGRVKISDTVNWSNRVSLLGGHGNGTNAPNRTRITWAGAAGGTMFDTTDFGDDSYIHNMWLRYLQIYAYDTDPDARAAHAIRFRTFLDHGSNMRDFQLSGFPDDAVIFDRGGHNLHFRDFRADHCLGYAFRFTPEATRSTSVTFEDFTADNEATTPTSGGFVHFDLSSTEYLGSETRVVFRNALLETNISMASGVGMIRVTPNPASPQPLQFRASFDNVWNSVRPGATGPTLLVDPASDYVAVTIGDNCKMTVEGIPIAERSLVPSVDNRAFSVIAPITTDLMTPGAAHNRKTLAEVMSNFHLVGNLWQHRKRAVAIILNTLNAADWDFPTRLRAGMLFMDPALNTAARMVIQKVTNDDATAGQVTGITATGTNGTNTVVVNDVGDLQVGHYITIAGVAGWFPIININAATNTLTLGSNLNATVTDAAVGLLAPQATTYQWPHKASAAPSSGTWERGDIVWNADAAAGGKAGWICVTAGTPGTWKEWGVIDA